MSEEEKKAIEVLKSKRASEQLMISGKMCVDILLNLIEKQQKELEQEKEKNKNLIKQLQEQNTEIQDTRHFKTIKRKRTRRYKN